MLKKITLIFCILVFIASISIIIMNIIPYFEAKNDNDKINDLLNTSSQTSQIQSDTSSQESVPEEKPIRYSTEPKDFTELKATNSDFIGWVNILDTVVDYPVVQSADNDKYLNRNFFGKPNKLGTVFADYNANISEDFVSNHVILYGHSAQDGSYFSSIRKYRDAQYLKDNPLVRFDTEFEVSYWAIIAIHSLDSYDFSDKTMNFYNTNFTTQESFDGFVSQITSKSLHKPNIDAQYGDQLISLYTCDYTFEGERFIVTARKLREGENPDEIAQNYTLLD